MAAARKEHEGREVIAVPPDMAFGTGHHATTATVLRLLVDEAELARRREAWRAPEPVATRGYAKLYTEHVLQADKGADFDFLVGGSGAEVPRESH